MTFPLLTTGRLARAARRAGATTGGVLDVLRVSGTALAVAAARSPRKPGLRNAQRHFAWQACLTARHGEALARAVADAHEQDATRPEDTTVDRHNNEVGRRYGASHAEALRAMPVGAAVSHLCRLAVPLWRSGELSVVSRRR